MLRKPQVCYKEGLVDTEQTEKARPLSLPAGCLLFRSALSMLGDKDLMCSGTYGVAMTRELNWEMVRFKKVLSFSQLFQNAKDL